MLGFELFQRHHQPLAGEAHRGFADAVLAVREVVIERALGGASHLGNLVNPGGGVAVAAEQRGGGPHDRAAVLWGCRHGAGFRS